MITIDGTEYVKVDKDEIKAFTIGETYFIRSVTHHYIGKLIGFDRDEKELILKPCVWVADDGRFTPALRDGALSEVEPYPPELAVTVNRETFVDASKWLHPIPDKQMS